MRFFLQAGLCLLLAAPLSAQSQVLDQGRFIIQLDGHSVGEESFVITEHGRAVSVEANVRRGRAHSGFRMEMRTEGYVPLGFRLENREIQLQGTVKDGRASVHVATPRGERHREFVAGTGTTLMPKGFSHGYYFLVRHLDAGTSRVQALDPTDEARWVRIERLGATADTTDEPEIRLHFPNGETHDLWLSDAGLVERVSIPARGFTAVRG